MAKREKKDALDKKMEKVKNAPPLEQRPARNIMTHTGITISSIAPENKNLKKEDFIANRKKQREKAKKMADYSAKIDKGEA